MEASFEFCSCHSENQISHVCLLKNCLKPLCIRCIPNHLILHGNKKECPILEEVSSVKSKCINSLIEFIENYHKITKNFEISSNNTNENPKDDHYVLIDNLKALIIKMIDLHFEKVKNNYCEYLRKQTANALEKKKELEVIFCQVERIYTEIMNNQNTCENLKVFLASDFETSFSNSLKHFEEAISVRRSYNVIKVDEIRINEIKESIKKCLFLQESTTDGSEEIKISRNDYFDKECKRNYLHYFEEQSKNLHLLNIEDYSNHIKSFSTIEMDIDFLVPDYHRSISTPNGDIYLIGGEMTLSEFKPTTNSVFTYDFNKKTLIRKCPMISERNSFGVIFLCGFIYVFGGFDKDDEPTTKCERYSILLDEWSPIADIPNGITDCCVAKFNCDSVFLFGGLKENNEINQNVIKYDVDINKWFPVSFVYDDEIQQSGKFSFPYLAGCCQINEEEILIFGGKDYNLNFSSQILIMEIKETVNVKIVKKNLKFPGSFDNLPILMNNNILSLQNTQDEINEGLIICKKRILRIEDKSCIYD